MSLTIALVGNPNSGKTTLFNDLTGARQYVGNWPGVTVERKEGPLKHNKEVTLQDLPGVYSLSPTPRRRSSPGTTSPPSPRPPSSTSWTAAT